jgi:hypothetical protein
VRIDGIEQSTQVHVVLSGVTTASIPLAGTHARSSSSVGEAPPQAASEAQPLMPSTAGENGFIARRNLRMPNHCRAMLGRPARRA